ncbi:hypothetical protein CLU96_2950 [Chryseobacterium sp. 52]|uniref:pirin family protein n=1 Tax=Chryseobacterium sp. 52 TaxID=2035213 RepID=UPI000C192491|nr:pirin-like C-terminal cupin domain-containing protein [Chryseobacterium sp. 52]PIF45934.1 hypothetical protein CLU96_2950 [Chryseobacterium sp. 52]
MKKQVKISTQGKHGYMSAMEYFRIFPTVYTQSVGPFVFLDYFPIKKYDKPTIMAQPNKGGVHPHKGIATLSYSIHGEVLHIDSGGHFGVVQSGGVAWFKAGKGAVHDDGMQTDTKSGELISQGLQFWVNLPAEHKEDEVDFMAFEHQDIPIKMLDNQTGWLKVIAGNYEALNAEIPAYTKEQFLYHLHLEAGKNFDISFAEGIEVATLPVSKNIIINDATYEETELTVFEVEAGTLSIENKNNSPADLIIFGGNPYEEKIVAQGPFVMNTNEEIAQAYQDFHAGKFGTIDYSVLNKNE